MATKPSRRIARPALFICDIQEKFRPAIWQYQKIITTTQKLLKAADILSIPIFATTQNRAKLGETCSELSLHAAVEHVDKSAFSMWVPAIAQHFSTSAPSSIAIVGIEAHICVTQTTLDLLANGHTVYIIIDGVSSCNKEEIGIALDRLRAEGAKVVSSESWMYEVMGDAGIPEFRSMAGLVKETNKDTSLVLSRLISKI